MRYVFNPFNGDFDAVDMPAGAYFTTSGDTLLLNWNGFVVQSWSYSVTATTTKIGNPIGLLLGLTYATEGE